MTDAGRLSTRADRSVAQAMAAFLYRAAGSPDVTLPEVSPFLDVASTDAFYTEIVWAFQQGIAKGTEVEGGFEFRAAESITREAVAAFLYRAAGSPAVALVEGSPFSDVEPGSTFATEIAWLAENHIANGNEDGTFGVHESVTREAVAAFLHRAAAVAPVVG